MEKNNQTNLKETINNVSKQISHTQNPTDINNIIETLVSNLLQSEFASLWIFDKYSASLKRYRNDNSTNEISMLGQQGVLAKCFFTLSSGIFNHIASQKEYSLEVDNPDNIRIKSKIILPIIESDNFLGIITAYSSIYKIKNFTTTDLDILQALEPLIKQAIYAINPKLKSQTISDDIYISKSLQENTSTIANKVNEIQKNQIQNSSKSNKADNAYINILANTVHDIRTPANTLYGFLELLEEQLEDKRLLEYIHNAKESASFINELTTSILDNITLKQEQRDIKEEILNPTKFFADITKNFSSNMYNKNLTFNIYIDPSIPKEIKIKSILLKRVIMNLLNNAYKFTPSNKSIEFQVLYKEAEKKLKIIISDTGIGIAPQKQQEIFQAFKQAEEDTKEKYGGTGLGLSISSEYVSKLGGELKLKSELDVGSSFYFTIPVNVTDETKMYKSISTNHIQLAIIYNNKNLLSSKNILKYLVKDGLDKNSIIPLNSTQNISTELTHIICFQSLVTEQLISFAKQHNISLMIVEEKFLSMLNNKEYNIISKYEYYADKLFEFISSNKPIKVLIADDDKINISLIKAILENELCTIETTTNGKDAFELLKTELENNNPYDIVYLDKHMPYMEGHEVLKKYRELEKQKNHKIFAVSISGDINDNQVGTLFDQQVSKPFNKTAIKKILKQI